MTVNRSDFVGKPQRSSVDADALGIYWDPTDPQGEPFVAPMNAHDASAISVLDTAGNWTATDVEGVLAEVPSRYGTQAPATYIDNWFHANTDISQTTQLVTNGLALFRRVWFPAGLLVPQIGVRVSVVGSAGSVIRLGIYDEIKGIPTNLLLDAGTQSGTATGLNPVTINWTAPATGWYNLVAVPQGAPATNPTLIVGRPVNTLNRFPNATFIADTNGFQALYRVGITGALPNPLGGVASDAGTNSYVIAFSTVNP